MSLRTPLGRVLGKGAAKEGPGHWWMQRVTSIALLPLTLWFVIALGTLPSFGYATVTEWIGGTWTAVLLILLVLVIAHHSNSGLQVVVEDYIHGAALKYATLLALLFTHLLLAAVGVVAILRVALRAVS